MRRLPELAASGILPLSRLLTTIHVSVPVPLLDVFRLRASRIRRDGLRQIPAASVYICGTAPPTAGGFRRADRASLLLRAPCRSFQISHCAPLQARPPAASSYVAPHRAAARLKPCGPAARPICIHGFFCPDTNSAHPYIRLSGTQSWFADAYMPVRLCVHDSLPANPATMTLLARAFRLDFFVHGHLPYPSTP